MIISKEIDIGTPIIVEITKESEAPSKSTKGERRKFNIIKQH
jgi:hypothetical protein